VSRKPTRQTILATVRISDRPERGADPLRQCNVCGTPSREMTVWREHDERDRPIEDARRVVYLGKDHSECRAYLDDHPRLYSEIMGDPGSFPICGDCLHRSGFRCGHPDLKVNGGDGLRIELSDPFRGAVCVLTSASNIADGRMRRAIRCVGNPARDGST
jgi:hypothetical protein